MVHSRAHIWFVAPAVILMAVLLIAPVLVAAVLSFSDYSLGNPTFEWVGLENYDKLTSRSSYQKMFTASLTYVLGRRAGIGGARARRRPSDFEPAFRR